MFPKFPPDEKYLNAKDYPEIAKKWTMFRRRKQVSSHAQVIKEFFKPNWACESVSSSPPIHSVTSGYHRIPRKGDGKESRPTGAKNITPSVNALFPTLLCDKPQVAHDCEDGQRLTRTFA